MIFFNTSPIQINAFYFDIKLTNQIILNITTYQPIVIQFLQVKMYPYGAMTVTNEMVTYRLGHEKSHRRPHGVNDLTK